VNPRDLGAKCDSCPLNGQKPVRPQMSLGATKLVVLGEAPSKSDTDEGKPFTAGSGYQLDVACRTFKVQRKDLYITNAVMCSVPGKKFKGWAQAIECCRPRLEAELAAIPTSAPLLACGEKALKAVTGKDNILDWVGGPLEGAGGRVIMPNVHPRACMAKPALLPVFRTFFGRALQIAQGTLPLWQWPPIEKKPGLSMVQMLERIRDSRKPVAIDVEAVPNLVLICIATEDGAASIPYPIEDGQIGSLVEEIFEDETVEKVFHNAIFDIIKLKEYGYEIRGPIFDTILAHAIAGPELPHNLGFAAAVEFWSNRWKTEYQLAKKLKKLHLLLGPNFGDFQEYNGRDAIATAMLRIALIRRLKKTYRGEELFAEMTNLAAKALKMADYGMLVDKERLAKHRVGRAKKMEDVAAKFREIIPDEQYKLGKTGQDGSLSRLFFEGFGLRPSRYTDEGEPSLDEATLEDIIATGHPQASQVARLLKEYREHGTVISRYIDKLPLDGQSILHPNWKVFGTITGRWSSARPNAQNWPMVMRNVVVARPGNYIVGADFSQLELRIIALLAGDEKLLQWYNEGLDVHTITAKMLFAEQLAKTGVLPKGARDIAKTVEYAFNYQSSQDVTTVWKTAVVQFPFLTVARMQKYRRMWFAEHPWILSWQKRTIKQASKAKYVEAPLSGRRRHFQDGIIDPNEVLNFPNQATAADLTNKAIIALDKALPDDSRILAQVHDAIYVEGPNPDLLRQLLVTTMTQTVTLNGNTMVFPVDVGVGRDWTCSLKYSDKDPACFKDFVASLSSWFSSERPASQAA
jgi:uracil-DNA glycosylase family 4